jgi:hypothetical protein
MTQKEIIAMDRKMNIHNLIAALEHATEGVLECATDRELRQIILLSMDLTERAQTVSEIREDED